MVFKIMKKRFFIMVVLIAIMPALSYSQKFGFISSDLIRDKFPEAKLADQRINSFVEEWKRELAAMDKHIEDLKFEIQKNRLVWSEQEKMEKDRLLEDANRERATYARKKFETGGEYEGLVQAILQPVEKKIFAAVQETASDEGIDFVFDKSLQPMPYSNYKYDLTLKVLRKLGVDVNEMEKDLQSKIDADPRNQKIEPKTPPSSRKRSRRGSSDENTEITPKEPEKPGSPGPGRPGFLRPEESTPPNEKLPEGPDR